MSSQDIAISAPGKGTALITGASTGIGAVYAERLARRGYDLVLVARNKERLEALAERLVRETGRRVEVLAADLTATADLRRVEERLRSDERITLLLNNAGLGATATLLDSDPDQIDTMIQLNVVALTRLTRAVAPGFVARGGGALINIASIVALSPELLNGSYSGSKAYVVNLSQSLHHELGAKGVKVQAVLPGATRTDFWGIAGVPVEHLPQEIVMSAEDLVDSALAGFDAGELITIPSLPDVEDWKRFDAARQALGPNLSRSVPAARYANAAIAVA
ncbi:AraC family transcriptional regulator [Variovorax paradoxus]|jgi:short-subunit dehydrogenase|uniref:SDR family NAD(P)-dependent oxidoreductase n=1 Tax=Variovorax paradoxus TaxID=34073 RepID=UPI0006E6DDB4|nr:AraC family transcriptional regulator [Variovorax paradoxus]KPU90381.1 AraC family transcriptional regulator [Variovorax paradoxus]KPU98234.1 AraC family transcriptional regulator [Variovorax paradoxus]KPV15645.1 AraC family transcriptional regulator [Variovorax paradoxus]KPV23841.1 AraC family transcriptional regulator [Variovorax paradoxus]